MEYRRIWQPGGTYFFTHNLLDRKNNLLTHYVETLRHAVYCVRKHHPFIIHGWVVLPDHIHCVIELPEGDSNFALRWQLIKLVFSKGIPKEEFCSNIRLQRAERGIWQRRYWEHLIRDQRDFNAHLDYVHINPVKHGLVQRVCDWPYSTFHKCVAEGIYPIDWGGEGEGLLQYPD